MSEDYIDEVFGDEGNSEEGKQGLSVEVKTPIESDTVKTVDEGKQEPVKGEITPNEEAPESAKVPVAAVQAERQKRQAAEEQATTDKAQSDTEITSLRNQIAQMRQQQVQPQTQQQTEDQSTTPDPLLDPEGFQRHIMDQMQEREYQGRLMVGVESAITEHGEAYIAKADIWATQMMQDDPTFGQRARASQDPIKFALDQYSQHQQQASITAAGGFDAYIDQQIAAKLQQATPANAESVEKVTLPSSMADIQPAGRQGESASTQEPTSYVEDIFG
ncbi:MAG: hypothetical protein COB36_14795 [Alphaproteobacteria bacterium]|nr:MAG: hypothetical protein COB36_14795 [Alphaproteobacteria bacterium]